jgi:hypothetical protein
MDVVEYPWRIARESDPGEGHFPAVQRVASGPCGGIVQPLCITLAGYQMPGGSP